MTTNSTLDAQSDYERNWQAFMSRDASADGAFVCGIESTGIYCRPTCPARRPTRSHVRFFETAQQARRAGYRACLRCHPDSLKTVTSLVQAACSYIDGFIEFHQSVPTAGDISNAVGVSSARLNRLFKDQMSLTTVQFAKGRRLERFKSLMREGQPVTEAVYDSGFGSSSRVYEQATRQLGMRPATYRKGGAGANIRYVTCDSSLGGMLMAATTAGVCAIKFGDDRDAMVAELRSEFPRSTLVAASMTAGSPDDGDLEAWVSTLRDYLAGGRLNLELPLDILATAFQWQVWQMLRTIPAGETRTYQNMASDLARPGASRAVGRACATNPVAPVIPCHRAVRKDGGLAGYRWGLDRKQALLDLERTGSRCGG